MKFQETTAERKVRPATDLFVSKAKQPLWEQHQRKWSNCKKCPIGMTTHSHVLVRGCIPAQVFFLGEAPGNTEDTLGIPFVGKAGKLLDTLLIETMVKMKKTFSFAIANVIACFPLDITRLDEGQKFRQPTEQEALACRPRITQQKTGLLELVNPKAIVLLGAVADKLGPPQEEFGNTPVLKLLHPSYLLRMGGASHRNLNYKRTYHKLANFLQDIL